MRIRKRIIEYFCCLLVINLLVAPVTHASWVLSTGNADSATETSQHCEQMAAVKAEADVAASGLAGPAAQAECEHGSACKLLCSVAAPALPNECTIAGFAKSTQWLPAIVPQLHARFLSRLDRPPTL